MPGGAVFDPFAGVHVGHKAEKALRQADSSGLRAALVDGERVVAVFGATSLSPMMNLFVLTDQRALGLQSSDLSKKGIKVEVRLRDVVQFAGPPSQTKLVATLRDGVTVQFGGVNGRDRDDVAAFLRSAAGAASEDAPGTYISSKATKVYAKATAAGLLDLLAPGERIVGVFSVPTVSPTVDLLVVTTARVGALQSSKPTAKGFQTRVYADELPALESLEPDAAGAPQAPVQITGMGNAVRVSTAAGESVFLASSLAHRPDHEPLKQAVLRLITDPPPAAVLAGARLTQDSGARVAFSAESPYMGPKAETRYAAALSRGLSNAWAEGEHVLAAVAVNSMRPAADLLVITNARAMALTSTTLGSWGSPVSVFADQVREAQVTDFRNRVTVTRGDGEPVRLGDLGNAADRPAVLQVFEHITRSSPPGPELLAAARAVSFPPQALGAEEWTPDTDADVPYLSPRFRDRAAAVTAAAQALLLPSETLAAVVHAPGSRSNLLLVTSARAIGASAKKGQEPFSHVWTAAADQVLHFDTTSVTGTLRITMADHNRYPVGAVSSDDLGPVSYFLRRLLETSDADVVATLASSGAVALSDVITGSTNLDVALDPAHTSATVKQALADGFPEKHVALIEPMMAHLEAAEVASAAGDILAEEAALRQAAATAAGAGLLASWRPKKWLESQVLTLTRAQRLRRGAEILGSVGQHTQVWNDRIFHRSECYLMDEHVTASVEVDGQVLKSSRPTLTRMAVGSVLPGSALLVGLALPKKTTEDTRSAHFNIVHPRWRISEKLDPDRAHQTRALAAQINATADSLARAADRSAAAAPANSVPPDASAIASPAAAPSGNKVDEVLDQLERLGELEDAGRITPEQAATMRARILGD